MKRLFFCALLAFPLVLLCTGAPRAWAAVTFGAPQDVINTGILQSLFSEYKRQTGKTVKVVPLETREQAVTANTRGIDLVLSDSPLNFSAGSGKRIPLMRSELVLAGPAEDRARVRGLRSVLEAFRRIDASGSLFVSRADGSANSIKESDLWKEAGINTQKRGWYMKGGHNMTETLEIAFHKRAYTLTDRVPYILWKNRFSLEPLVYSDPRLFFTYEVIEIAPEGRRGRETGGVLKFLESDRAKEIIRKFGSERYGTALYSVP